MKALFLDIDGVLNSEEWARSDRTRNLVDLDEVALKRLQNIIATTGAKIVLSSTWRLVPELVQLLRKRGLDIFDLTPRHGAFGTRNLEIAAWLEAHDVESFAIVDDDEDAGYGSLAPHFVQTDFKVGLTTENANQLISLLGALP